MGKFTSLFLLAATLSLSPSAMMAQSDSVWTLPYVNNFNTQEDFNQLTAKDADGDGTTWAFDSNRFATNSGGSWGKPDDWLFTPVFKMTADREYSVAFKTYSAYDSYNQKFNVVLGSGSDVKSYTDTLVADISLSNTTPQTISSKFKVNADGNYRVAFHIYASAPFYGAVIDSLCINELTKFSAPDSVTELRAAGGDKGAKAATLTFRAPAKTAGGSTLASISRIDVMRDNSVRVKSIDSPKPGELLTVVDSDKTMTEGTHTYSVTPYAGEDKGNTATVSVFIGEDTPAAPTAVFATDNLDGTTHITWTMPPYGAKGGYVDTAKLKYNLYYYKEGVPVFIESLSSTSVNINIEAPGGMQQMVVFGVNAVSDAGDGSITQSNEYIVGDPHKLPFMESFPSEDTESGIWVVHDGVSSFRPENRETYDNDGGAVYFTSTYSHDVSSIESGKITLDGAENPKLTFRYLAYPGDDAQLTILVRKNGEINTDTLQTTDYKTLTGDSEWRTSTLSLAKYKDTKYVTVLFRGEVNNASTAVVIDDIDLRDVKPRDLSAAFQSISDTIVAGRDITAYVKVKNMGDNSISNYQVKLFVNGEQADLKTGATIAPHASETLALNCKTNVADKQLPVYATVETDGDGDISNNNTDTINIALTAPNFPTVTDLSAKREETGVRLSWTEMNPKEEEVTEGFDTYKPFIIGGIGDWSLTDGDGKPSAGFKAGAFTHSGDPFAYIVFNPTTAGINLDEIPNFKPHSGNQFLAAITTSAQNDDWLVSPELTGKAQTVKLFTRSYMTTYGKEKFEIRYSTNGKDTADFKTIVSTNEAPAEWTEYTAQLPAGTKYFAIHYISYYDWMLMIDDITYTPKPLKVNGYNIYRDNKEIATCTTGSYTDSSADSGEHTYNVSVIYDAGESALSNAAAVTTTGITNYSASQSIHHADVYLPDGRRCFSGNISSIRELNLAKGQYIIRTEGKTENVLIR